MSQATILVLVAVGILAVVLLGMLAKHIVGQRREAGWAQRRTQLFNKYRDEDVVEKIMSRMIWKHMTRDQLLDSWGRPAQEDERRESGRRKEILRYRPLPGRPFGQRVILENDKVIGWDTKGA
jgi:hypothetical protein